MASTETARSASRLPASGWLRNLLFSLGFRGRILVIAIPFLWLLLYFVVPFLIVIWVSTSFIVIDQPPYTHIGPDGNLTLNIGDSYGRLFSDALYIKAYLNSLFVAAVSTIICLVIGYPFAYGIARCSHSVRNILLMLVILPFWTSFLIRVYAWIGLLKNNGLINDVLIWIGLIDSPIGMMNTNFAVYLGIVYSYLPFMILPLYANLEKMDMSLLEAANDLGCRPLKAFFVITVPLSFPGIVAGSMLVFIPAVGEYVIPELLGGPSSLMIGRILWSEFFSNRDWPTASAVAIAILLALVVPLMIYQKYQDKELEKESMTNRLSWFVIFWLVVVFAFLYAPIVSVVIYSFNASKLVTVWAGWSFKWYGELAKDRQIIDAALLSLEIAAISSTLATILGTIAGYVLVRFPKFMGRTAFSGMVNAPLVMPEVITGLSMLLLFISMQEIYQWAVMGLAEKGFGVTSEAVRIGFSWIDGRGLITVIIAHVTFTMSYIAVVMRSRFLVLDLSLEEAAQDLGARPLKVFFVITLPIVLPAIISGWLLGFTISLDDLVITSFTNGPGTTTLPQVVFSKVRLGLDPKINALATIIIAIVSIGVIFATIHMRRQEKQRQRDEQMAIRAIAKA